MEGRVGIEYIKVFVRCEKGKTICICERSHKRCRRHCTPDVVERDKYRDWEDTFRQDRYGKSK